MNFVLAGVDRAAFIVTLAHRLRARGVPVGFNGLGQLTAALDTCRMDNRSDVYWASRITLVRRQSELPIFDAVFAAVFDAAGLPTDPHARRYAPERQRAAGVNVSVPADSGLTSSGEGLPWATLPQVTGETHTSEADLVVPERLPSALDHIADIPFEQLSPDQLGMLGSWLSQALASWPRRRSRRHRVDATGHRVALRQTVARARRTGWEAVELVRSRPVYRPRRVVLLCDFSQSMQAQATAYIHLMRALTMTTDTEAFGFATRLTRLTSALAHKSTETAIEQATEKVTDRFGGTRIAANIQALLSSHHGGLVRGAVVVIGSDGWDSASPADLAAAMARLRRRAYRVIWMNPRAAAPGYEPTVGSMAAALPYCDAHLAADTFRSLVRVIEAISSTALRGSTGGSGRR